MGKKHFVCQLIESDALDLNVIRNGYLTINLRLDFSEVTLKGMCLNHKVCNVKIPMLVSCAFKVITVAQARF